MVYRFCRQEIQLAWSQSRYSDTILKFSSSILMQNAPVMFPMTKTDEKMVYGERASEQALLRLRQSKRNRESFLSAAENAYSAQLAFK